LAKQKAEAREKEIKREKAHVKPEKRLRPATGAGANTNLACKRKSAAPKTMAAMK
jgi:hypothetical protein